MSRNWTWNGGIQLELTFKMKEFADKIRISNLLSLERCTCVITPHN
uniref:Uncharacterized protein n=1 Tax=Rhizophora mucronata TaxID=61149 RepID=A0A2P2P8S5_RHIMU